MSHPKNRVLVIAHRGASGIAPENTLSAIKEAMAMGADMIELDIRQTRNGTVVIIHDKTVSRTSDGKGSVKDFTFEELGSLDAGSWFHPGFKNEKIPSLDSILQEVKDKAKLLIEVKENRYSGIEKNIVQLLNKHAAKDWCIIQSFETGVLNNIKNLDPSIEIHKLVIGNIRGLPLHIDNCIRLGSIYKYNEVAAININFKLLNKKIIQKIHGQGQKVNTWTVNDPEDMKKMIEMDVDGIITNYPDQLIKVLGQYRKS